MSLDPYLLVAHEHQRELQSAARRQALVRLATCCRPSTWRRAVTVVAARRRPSPPCCTEPARAVHGNDEGAAR